MLVGIKINNQKIKMLTTIKKTNVQIELIEKTGFKIKKKVFKN